MIVLTLGDDLEQFLPLLGKLPLFFSGARFPDPDWISARNYRSEVLQALV